MDVKHPYVHIPIIVCSKYTFILLRWHKLWKVAHFPLVLPNSLNNLRKQLHKCHLSCAAPPPEDKYPPHDCYCEVQCWYFFLYPFSSSFLENEKRYVQRAGWGELGGVVKTPSFTPFEYVWALMLGLGRPGARRVEPPSSHAAVRMDASRCCEGELRGAASVSIWWPLLISQPSSSRPQDASCNLFDSKIIKKNNIYTRSASL